MSNNRFKFRVWDKKNSEYVPDGETCDVHCSLHRDGTLDCGIAYDDGYAGGIDWVKTEDAIIEQCTGLKDKNGKLIYEGDVVLALESWSDRKREFNVIYCDKEYGFLFVDGFKNTKALFAFLPEELEIVGNIHEMESKNE